jgi:hypothetical protein
MPKKDRSASSNIFEMLLDMSESKKKRTELSESTGVKGFFDEECIEIDVKTCRGVECRLSIKACPTSALY